jgi:hypothetical protein
MNFDELQKMMREKIAKIEQEDLKMDTINGINEYLRRRGSLNEEETKKQENPSKEVQIRFIKKVETDKTENKKTEQNEEEE